MIATLGTVLTILTFIGVVFSVITAVSLAWVSLRNKVQKQTLEHLEKLTATLTERVDALEDEREELKSRVQTLEQENSVLRSMVTGEVKLAELTGIVRDFHDEIRAVFGEIRTAVARS